ncbi:hypothetical protein HGRIS_001530 [Hohenbuehelia grisea]|uniref:Uncharacterized protein n=1 Tax=Hohenbuehelia grisea TaxID=104357 RepID=A0ABR3JQX2_9AGAR
MATVAKQIIRGPKAKSTFAQRTKLFAGSMSGLTCAVNNVLHAPLPQLPPRKP